MQSCARDAGGRSGTWSGARSGDPLEDMCAGMSHAGSWREEDRGRERRSASSPPGRASEGADALEGNGTGTREGFRSVRGGLGGAARVGRKVGGARGVAEVAAHAGEMVALTTNCRVANSQRHLASAGGRPSAA